MNIIFWNKTKTLPNFVLKYPNGPDSSKEKNISRAKSKDKNFKLAQRKHILKTRVEIDIEMDQASELIFTMKILDKFGQMKAYKPCVKRNILAQDGEDNRDQKKIETSRSMFFFKELMGPLASKNLSLKEIPFELKKVHETRGMNLKKTMSNIKRQKSRKIQ